MKTSILCNKNISFYMVTTLLIIIAGLSPSVVSAQFESGQNSYRLFDHVINRQGQSRLSLFTGIPVVASTEYAYGISDRLTFGVFGGTTPFEEALGIRVRTVLFERLDQSYRVYFCPPLIFYPQRQRENPDAWFITRPNINFEWGNAQLRYKVGASVIAMASHQDLFGDPSLSKHSPEIWTAIHGGVSLPVGAGTSFQAELSYVTKGWRTVDSFVGGPPFILMTGFSQVF